MGIPLGDWLVLMVILVVVCAFVKISRAVLDHHAEEKKFDGTGTMGQMTSQTVINNMVDGIITIDEKGIIMQPLNPAAQRIFGYSAVEAIGRKVNIFMPEPYSGQHDAYLSNYKRTGHAKIIGISREVVGKRKDGSTFPLELTVSEFILNGQKYFTGIVRDITDRKVAEEERKAAERRKDEFLAMLSHELRNPLSPVMTTLYMLERQYPDLKEEGLDIAQRQIQHMIRLIDDLLDVSRISRGKIELEPEVYNIRESVDAALIAVANNMEKKAQRLYSTFHPGDIFVRGDKHRLQQVFTNILHNASKYTPGGGVIRIGLHVVGERCVFVCADNGIGIAADVMPHVFEMFMQAPGKKDGLGLGLTLVKSLLEMQGGSVRLSSQGVGQGTTVTVEIPIVDGDMKQQPKQDAVVDGSQETVLVIDDNRDSTVMMAKMLKLAGYNVYTAFTGEEGLQVVQTQLVRPRIILLDLGLPDIDGYEVCRRLRELYANLCIVAISGFGSEDDKRKCREVGFNYHLTKPARPEEILRVIRDACRLK